MKLVASIFMSTKLCRQMPKTVTALFKKFDTRYRTHDSLRNA
jgi:hypothetical protein